MAASKKGTNLFSFLLPLHLTTIAPCEESCGSGTREPRDQEALSKPEGHEEHEREVEGPSDEEGGQAELVPA